MVVDPGFPKVEQLSEFFDSKQPVPHRSVPINAEDYLRGPQQIGVLPLKYEAGLSMNVTRSQIDFRSQRCFLSRGGRNVSS
jgi:hypothetical protein